MSKTDYLENAILGHILCGTPYAAPSQIYVGLMVAPGPTETQVQGEVSGNGYSRKLVTFTSASGGQVSNSSDVTFDVATPAGWGTLTSFALFDAPTGGNALYYGTLTAQRIIQPNDQVKFPIGSLVVQED